MLALPGCVYLYQGEELGLEEVEDLPEALLQDPTWLRSGHTVRGRDGCRVPLPWSDTASPFGFGPPGTVPWLPQPAGWRERTAAAQTGDPDSFLELYRSALRLRREHLGSRGTGMTWLPSPETVLRFECGGGVETIVNLGPDPIALTGGRPVLLASEPTPTIGACPATRPSGSARPGPASRSPARAGRRTSRGRREHRERRAQPEHRAVPIVSYSTPPTMLATIAPTPNAMVW